MNTSASLKAYLLPLVLIISILLGSVAGFMMHEKALIFKPIGDIFLNLLFTVVVPLVFFSVASAVASLDKSHQLFKLIVSMFITFIFTGVIAAAFMILIVMYFPPAFGVVLKLPTANAIEKIDIASQIVSIFTVSDFSQLFSHKNMLPLIVFSFLVGLAAAHTKTRTPYFTQFLTAGAEVFMRVISIVMYLAPVGFFAFFAVLVAQFGPQFVQQYVRVTVIYYIAAIIYFIAAFTAYAYLGNGFQGIKKFWGNVLVPMLTSLATCSSAASIPANLEATKKMDVPASVYETVIPIGAIMHKDGSVLGAVVKIAFLFGLYGMSFSTPGVLVTALMIAILVGTVMGAIPSGGMLGEMLILSLYGFPPESLIIIAAISILIDPIATMLNVTGDSLCSMMTARMMGKRA